MKTAKNKIQVSETMPAGSAWRKAFCLAGGLLVSISVYILMVIFFSFILIEERTIKGTEYSTTPPAGLVFFISAPATIIIIFLYKKVAKKFNL